MVVLKSFAVASPPRAGALRVTSRSRGRTAAQVSFTRIRDTDGAASVTPSLLQTNPLASGLRPSASVCTLAGGPNLAAHLIVPKTLVLPSTCTLRALPFRGRLPLELWSRCRGREVSSWCRRRPPSQTSPPLPPQARTRCPCPVVAFSRRCSGSRRAENRPRQRKNSSAATATIKTFVNSC